MNNFSEWLRDQIKKMGWTQAELARRSGVSPAQITRVLAGERNLGEQSLVALAKAFHLPPDEVFRKAGVLPAKPFEDTLTKEAEYLLGEMSEKTRQQAIDYIRYLYQQEMGNEETATRMGKTQPGTP